MAPRVAFNALFLHYPFSGTGRYVDQLIDGARARVDLLRLGAAAFPPVGSGRAAEQLITTPFDRRARNLAKIWFEQIAFPVAARRSGAHLAHYPYFAAPLWPGLPTVVTVHDLVPVVRPEYRRTAAQRLYTALVSRGLRSARQIITDSEASARDLAQRLAIPRERLQVIPLGVDGRFRPLETTAEREWAARVRRRHGLTEPFLLYLGGLDRRKNVDTLIRAFARLQRGHGLPHRLAVVGAIRAGDALFYDPRPDLDRLGVGEAVRLLGRIEDDEVRALHATAEAFVFPSLYEGFGLPPLEAMACGAAVVCSNTSSLPEVVGDAGLLFDPRNEEALVQALVQVTRDAELRDALRRRGLERARQFSWETTIRRTIQVWEEAGVGR